jgi:predicted methyltransferase
LFRLGETPWLITPDVARRILDCEERVSLDLGLSEVALAYEGKRAVLPNGSTVSPDDMEAIASRQGAVFFPRDGEVFQVAISDGHFYKMVPTDGAPTLEVDGVRMHRTVGVTPDVDARVKLEALGVHEGRGLDTCAGLGYTALACLEAGGDLVVSVELRYQVLRIAGVNPWSQRLFADERFHLLIGDAFDVIEAFPAGFFDYIIHDPPRFSHAGHLYSGEFYARLFRVLREGGRVFHYTGEPGSRYRRVDLRRGVMRRLRQAGFTDAAYVREVFGVVCEKPG